MQTHISDCSGLSLMKYLNFQYILKVMKYVLYLQRFTTRTGTTIMKLTEGKEKLIQAWGTLGSSWGINRTMAQVHALLLVSPGSLSAEEIMEELNISRGNANMNIRALIDWGLVSKELVPGERKEFFVAEKDIWKVAMQVIKERRRRELEPVLKMLEEISAIEGDKKNKDVKAFSDAVADIKSVVEKADKTLGVLTKADENWFVSQFMKLLK